MSKSAIKMTDNTNVDIGVKDSKRAEVAKELSGFLATTYTLYMKTLYYHWNVTGPQFHSLHTLFEAQYNDLHAAGDRIAERVRALGHFTPGTFKHFIDLSAIKEDAEFPRDATQMVKNLLHDNERASKEARKVLEAAQEADDEVSVDMMVGRMSVHEEAAWMLRATLG
jgi:starvation-inducible DNA-binding protein